MVVFTGFGDYCSGKAIPKLIPEVEPPRIPKLCADRNCGSDSCSRPKAEDNTRHSQDSLKTWKQPEDSLKTA